MLQMSALRKSNQEEMETMQSQMLVMTRAFTALSDKIDNGKSHNQSKAGHNNSGGGGDTTDDDDNDSDSKKENNRSQNITRNFQKTKRKHDTESYPNNCPTAKERRGTVMKK